MLQFLRVRQARNAAVAAIAPHVEASRRRLDGIPDRVWLDPYMVGFITMLITLIARNVAGSLAMEAMALVQSGAWARITGMKPELIGEEVCLLSNANDAAFAAGCRNAARFLQASFGDHADEWTREFEAGAESTPYASADEIQLWSMFFDHCITQMDYRRVRET